MQQTIRTGTEDHNKLKVNGELDGFYGAIATFVFCEIGKCPSSNYLVD
jgi:hypothetical protein